MQEEPFAVVLGLEVERLVSQQGLGVLDGIEELGTDVRHLPAAGDVGLAVGREDIPFGQLFPDDLVVDEPCGVVIHRAGCFRAGVERGATAPVGEVDHVSTVTRFDGDPVNFVRVLIDVMKCCVH